MLLAGNPGMGQAHQGQIHHKAFEVVDISFTEITPRENSMHRAKELNLSVGEQHAIAQNLLVTSTGGNTPFEMQTTNTAGLINGSGTIMGNASFAATMPYGWNQVRFAVVIICKQVLSPTKTTYITIQGFSETNNVCTPTVSGDAVFNMNEKIHINRISTYDAGPNGLIPMSSFHVLMDRWTDMSNENELTKLRPTDIMTTLDKIQRYDTEGGSDHRSALNGLATTSNMENSTASGFINQLVGGVTRGISDSVAFNSSPTLSATKFSIESNMESSVFIRELIQYTKQTQGGLTAQANSTFPLAFIDQYMDNFQHNARVIFADASVDNSLVQVGRGITQEFTANNGIQMKLSVAIAEAVGAIAFKSDLMTFVCKFDNFAIPSAQNGNSRLQVEYLGAHEFAIAGLDQHYTNNAIPAIVTAMQYEIDLILNQYTYQANIEIIGGQYINITISLDGNHGTASTHSYYADSLFNSSIGTNANLQASIETTNNLFTGIKESAESISGNNFGQPQFAGAQVNPDFKRNQGQIYEEQHTPRSGGGFIIN